MSGGSVRLVCAEVRAKALERAALRLNCSRDELSVVDGQFLQNGAATGQDYWTVAAEIDLTPGRHRHGAGETGRVLQGGRPQRAACRPAGKGERCRLRARRPAARTCCMPARCASPAAAPRWRRSTRQRSAAPRRANCRSSAKPTSSPSSARSRASPRPPPPPRRCMPRGTTCGASSPAQQEAAWLKGQPSDDRRIGAPPSAAPPKRLVQIDRLAALYRACLDGAVLRAGRVPRRPPHGVVARPGHASAAQEPGGGARPADRGDHRAAPARRRLLRPQRRRRCRARRGADRPAPARPVHPPAMAPRGGVRLRAGRPGHAGDPACRSRRARPAGRLDDGDLEPDPCPAAGQRQRLSCSPPRRWRTRRPR